MSLRNIFLIICAAFSTSLFLVVYIRETSLGVEYSANLQGRHQLYLSHLPEDLSFAGEKVHFRSPGAYRKFRRELEVNTKRNSSTRLLIHHVKIWMPEIEAVIKRHNIPEDFKYLALAESNLMNVVSPKQAAGFWQLRKETAEELGLEINDEVDERYHPIMATEAACKYFRNAKRVFSDWTSVAASYNRGISGLKRAYDDQQQENFYDLNLNDETARYLYKILSMKDLISHPERYGMQIQRPDYAYFRKVPVDSAVTSIPDFCRQLDIDYFTFKEYNRWILGNTLPNENGKRYIFIVPYSALGKSRQEPAGKNSKQEPPAGMKDTINQEILKRLL